MDTARLDRIYAKTVKHLKDPADLWIVESIQMQRLYLCRGDAIIAEYPASTSRLGVGIREDSLKTPPGFHRICEKIGAGAPAGRIFKDRVDTGVDWDGSPDGENLILSRILRLEGLERGVNRGPGFDTYERYVYIHGTNREGLVGTPLSHGCICLRNADLIELFDSVNEGTIVYIEAPPMVVSGRPCRGLHMVGIYGTGMSAIAQYLRFQGLDVSGSDRLLWSEDTAPMRRSLEDLGCSLCDQDGSGVTDDTDVLCISTAIEETNPDIAAARGRGIPIVHRSDVLAAIVASKRTVAVAGTSGKSTVTSMIFEFLSECGMSPSLISGAPLTKLESQGMIGNAFAGGSDLLVIEADESDGSLVRYAPEMSVILNVSRDHKTVEEIAGLFGTLISQSSWSASNADDPILRGLPATERFGWDSAATWRADTEELRRDSVVLIRGGVRYDLPLPGNHNLENLSAALCVCDHLGCRGEGLARAVRAFGGVARRFAVHSTGRGVTVIDDYAHNPAKITAVITTARAYSPRLIAVYQPHGFGPTRFLKDEYIAAFRTIFHEGDRLYLLPIYYAGGTAVKDISSEDIVTGLGSVPFSAGTVTDREELLERLGTDAHSGDAIVIMGARDPSLSGLVKRVIELFE